MSVLARYVAINFAAIILWFRVGGTNISGEINYPPLHIYSVLNANSRGE